MELTRRLDAAHRKSWPHASLRFWVMRAAPTPGFPAMRAQVDEVSFQTRASAGSRFRADEVDETISLLNWLLDDHFVLLGFREYDLLDTPEGLLPKRERVPGWGSCTTGLVEVVQADAAGRRRAAAARAWRAASC